MAQNLFFGQYARFDAEQRESGSSLLGSNSLVGDELKISFDVRNGKEIVKLFNRFDEELGVLSSKATHKLLLCRADGWELHALLSAVFCKGIDGVDYSGEVALLCFPQRYSEEFNTFLEKVRTQLQDGHRPLLNLRAEGVQNLLQHKGDWLPKDGEPKRKLEDGMVVVKDHLKHDEKMIEAARRRNPGCMIVGWAFIIFLVLAAIYVGYHLFF